MSMIVAAISSSGRTISAPPFFTSSPGMPQTIAVDSASAMVRPPPSRSRFIASAPSFPIPVIITPIILGAPKCSSALATMRSTLGCHKYWAFAGTGIAIGPVARGATMTSASPLPI